MKKTSHGSAAGFSLVELMIAMVVTLIVMGSVYGLMSGGQSAFRREPALTDRQQNIRVAMDRIVDDVRRGGEGAGYLVQAFWPGLNAVGPEGPTGKTDFLQIWAPAGECPDVPLNSGNPYNGGNLNAAAGTTIPDCYPEPGLVMIFYGNGKMKFGWGHNKHANKTDPTKFNFPGGQQPDGIQPFPLDCSANLADKNDPCPAGQTTDPVRFGTVAFIRYEIAIDSEGVPNLYRTTQGGLNGTGLDDTVTYLPAPDPLGGWQMVARGIEDLQVRYLPQVDYSAGTWRDVPHDVLIYDDVTREVEITLGARALVRNIQGATTATNASMTKGRSAPRGQLTTRVTPWAALIALHDGPSPSPPLWK